MKNRLITMLVAIMVFAITMTACGSKEENTRERKHSSDSTREIEIPDQDTINNNLSFEFERVYGDDASEQGVIICKDENGNVCWTFESEKVPMTELDQVAEIGVTGYGYLVLIEGKIVCFNKTNQLEPEILWENSDFMGASPSFTFDQNDNLYICGYYGPYLMKVHPDGTTEFKVEYLEEYGDCYWPYELVYENNTVKIRFESNDSVVIYDLDKMAVTGIEGGGISFSDYPIDDRGNSSYCERYKLPVVPGAMTDDLENFDNKIEELYEKYVKSAIDEAEDGYDPYVLSTEYEINVSADGSIYSVLVTIYGDYDMVEYYTFNFTADGNYISNSDLVAYYGIDENVFLDIVITNVTNSMQSSGIDGDSIADTTSNDNINMDNQIYINENGNLAVVVGEYVPAGAGYYYSLIEIEN